ncbi:24 kDa macrophage-induced major protein [Mesorhizobium loti]|nr:24 kDa macrophage-induced major protein [Mesorhizobium loti]
MQNIPQIDATSAPAKTQDLLKAVKKQMGGVPNSLATMAQSSAALGGYLGFAGALAAGSLSNAHREQLSLAVAGANACDYCASAHTALGKGAGLSPDEMATNLLGKSYDPKTAALLNFAREFVRLRGRTTDAQLATLSTAGFGHEAVVEIVANIALNIFTNYFNHIAGTEIDFPLVNSQLALAA